MNKKAERNRVRFQDPEIGATFPRRCDLKREGLWVPKNREKVEQDGMPKEVATEMLCRPGVRLTNRERKMYQRARCTVYKSTLEKFSLADRVAIRLQGVTWEQLNRWLLRHQAREKIVQTAYSKTQEAAEKLAAETVTEENKVILAAKRVVLQRILAGLQMRGSTHQLIIDALETEIDRRQKFIEHLQAIKQKELADKIAAELCPATSN